MMVGKSVMPVIDDANDAGTLQRHFLSLSEFRHLRVSSFTRARIYEFMRS